MARRSSSRSRTSQGYRNLIIIKVYSIRRKKSIGLFVLQNSLLGKFVHFFISTNSNDNNHHRCLSTAKLIDNAQTRRTEFDFQKSCKVSAVVIAERFAVALFINRQWILLNFFDGFQNKIALATI